MPNNHLSLQEFDNKLQEHDREYWYNMIVLFGELVEKTHY